MKPLVKPLADGAHVGHLDDVLARTDLLAFDEGGRLLHALHQVTTELVHLALLASSAHGALNTRREFLHCFLRLGPRA
jgi:hypothetical protein